jgi:hypothetical protein
MVSDEAKRPCRERHSRTGGEPHCVLDRLLVPAVGLVSEMGQLPFGGVFIWSMRISGEAMDGTLQLVVAGGT